MVAEERAVSLLKRGDIAGLEALVRQHGQEAVRLAALITRDRQAAEDVASACFIVAYERIHQFDQRRPFWPWFRRIVANAALKSLGHQARFSSLDELEETARMAESALASATMVPSDLEQQFESARVRQEVGRAIASLTPKQRAVIILRYFAGMNEAEIAGTLKIPGGTVKSRGSAAMNRLRRLLSHMRNTSNRAPE